MSQDLGSTQASTFETPTGRSSQTKTSFVRPKLSDFVHTPVAHRTWLSYELLPGTFPEQWAVAAFYEFNRKRLWHFNFGAIFVTETNELYYRQKILAQLKALNRILTQTNLTQTDLTQTDLIGVAESEIGPYIKRSVLEKLLSDCAAIVTQSNRAKSKSTESKNATSSQETQISAASRVPSQLVPVGAQKAAAVLSDLVRHYIQIYDPEYHFHISLQAYVAQTFHLPKEAQTLFTCDRKDGWLYLDYIGDGQDSLSAFNEKSTAAHAPQTFFSANCQILYRDSFDGKMLQQSAKAWLVANNQPVTSVGLIPLAKPAHAFNRNQVRELFANSNADVELRISKDGRNVSAKEFRTAYAASQPHYPRGVLEAATLWAMRVTYLDYPVNFLIDCHYRYVGSLWMIKQPYYWIRPRAFKLYFTASWPFRIVIYYFQYQISVGFIDYRTLANVYFGRLIGLARRLVTAMILPFHWARPHAFNVYFAVSRPVRKMYYFLKFQFEKRILGSKK